MTLNLTIKPAFISYSDKKLGEIRLMEHQEKARFCEDKMVILDAPTSSGKTLAILIRFTESEGNGMMLYPTNELIKDQGRGIKELFDKIGISSIVIPLEEDIGAMPDNLDVIIAVVTGDTLEGLAKTKGEALRNILRIVDGERRLLMLTNVDTLHLIFKMKYHRGRSLLSEFLNLDFTLLAVDELHLYSGVAFSNLLYLIWLLRDRFDQIIVSSATLHDSTKILKELFNHKVIQPNILSEDDGKSRRIRHELKLEIDPSKNILTNEDTERVLRTIKKLYKPSGSSEVDTLVIVNSVVFSEQLSEVLLDEYGSGKVSVINGLVPNELRKSSELTVGTSAVEVGVDFDIKNLVFEGTNAGSFIQRLGRCGRHRSGKAVAFIPVGAYKKLDGKLKDKRLTMEKLSRYTEQTITHLENYLDFSKSVYGATMFTSLIYPFEKSLTNLKRSWENLKPPFFDENHWNRMKKIANKKLIKVISEGGARGDLISTPIYIKKYKAYSRIDILNLPKTSFYFEDVENIDAPVPPWLTDTRVAVVDGYVEKGWVQGSWTGVLLNKETQKILFTRTVGDNTNLSLQLDDQKLEEKAKLLFNEKIVYPTNTYDLTDWRFPRIYSSQFKNKCLVIGLDGLVQKYVEEEI